MNTSMQKQSAVTAYVSSKQLLLLAFVAQFDTRTKVCLPRLESDTFYLV